MFSLSSLFTKSPSAPVFSKLRVDMHSHLIPGIDDGSPDLDTSLELVRGMQSLGFEKLITTPHVMKGLYPNTSALINQGLEALRDGLAEAKISVELEAAAEYFVDMHLEELIETGDLLGFGTKRFVLIEMSFVSASPNFEKILFSLVAHGYRPILAHPERYTYLMDQLPKLRKWHSFGCQMQVNALSLGGYYGKGVQQWATVLVKEGIVDFLGTDLHHQQHLALLSDLNFDRKINTLMEARTFQNATL